MQYKGYTARVELDQEAGVLFGEVEGLRDVVTFEATDVRDLEAAFHESVDDYLAMCAERGEEPERAYSGKFLVRIDPMVHREVAFAAAQSGTSLNAFVAEVLEQWMATRGPRSALVPGPNATAREGDPAIFAGRSPEMAVVSGHAGPSDPQLQLRADTPSSTTPNTPGATRVRGGAVFMH